MAVPPCALAAVGPNIANTFVAKVLCPAALQTFGSCQLVTGASAFATVSCLGDHYFVVRVEERAIPQFAHKLGKDINKMPGNPQVVWVRPLTRRLQRLFGWGDVLAARADVVRAAKSGDTDELRVLMPQAANISAGVNLFIVPDLYDALQGQPLPQLEDCPDDLCCAGRWDVPTCGPCAPIEGQPEAERHLPPYMLCRRCQKVTCIKCVGEAEEQRELQHDLQIALEKCRETPPSSSATESAEPSYTWRQHPEHPQPFCVIDQQKIPDAEKLAWMRQEIGDRADLPAFAQKWLDLFGEKLRGDIPQKMACIKLYGQYVPEEADARAWKKECNLPPDVLENFQRIWDADAPERCHECCSAAAPGTKHPVRRAGRNFCSRACAIAGTMIACSKCGHRVDATYPHCPMCEWGSSEPAPARRGHERTELAYMVEDSEKNYAAYMKAIRCTARVDPDHAPAWKKRRRS